MCAAISLGNATNGSEPVPVELLDEYVGHYRLSLPGQDPREFSFRRDGVRLMLVSETVKQVTGEDVTAEQLGGVDSHSHYSGVVHFVAESGGDGLEIARRLLSFLPSNNTDDPPFLEDMYEETVEPDEEMNDLVPENPRAAYDMHDVIKRVVDRSDFMEVQEHYAPNLIVGFALVLVFEGHQPGLRVGDPLAQLGGGLLSR